jgi:chromosome partitioning protein
MGIHCFSPIRDSAEFVNASAAGLPLQLYRPGHPARDDFQEIAEKLNQLVIVSREK